MLFAAEDSGWGGAPVMTSLTVKGVESASGGREWAIKVWDLLVKQEVNSLTKVEKPHVNLLEMVLPGIDRFELIKRIARITNAQAVFLRSGTATRTSLGPSKREPTTTS